jgi:O-acetylserine/cysteine efflux transporter
VSAVAMSTGAVMSPRDAALALLVVGLWGVNFVVMKHAVSEIPPLALTGIRFTLAAVPAVFLLKRPDVPWRIMLGFGLAFGVIKFGLLFTAFKVGMPSGLAALVLQLQAVFSIALAYVWFAEKPTRPQWAGLALALAGAVIVMAGVRGDAALLPVALTLAAAIAWGFANIATKAATRRGVKIDMLSFAAWTALMPGLVMLLASLVVEGPPEGIGALTRATPLGLAALTYLIWPVSLFSGALWGGLLARNSLAAVAPFALLIPIVGFLCGWIVYGETISGTTAFGAALILAGLCVTLIKPRSCPA